MPDNIFEIKGGNNVIAPSASTAPQRINHHAASPFSDGASDVPNSKHSAINAQVYVTHDAVCVPQLISKARRHMVLHAAFYPKYGFDNQGDDVSKAMAKNPNLRLTVIFTDVHALWVDEFAVTLRDYFVEEGEFARQVEITKRHFFRLRAKFGAQRVHIYDTARLPMFPVILIDDTLIVGHYAHSSVIPPHGLWFTIQHPKIPMMYESLLAGISPNWETEEERAILRYVEELILNSQSSITNNNSLRTP